MGGLGKNAYGISLGHENRKYVASQDWIDVKSWFFAADTNLRKLKITLIVIE